MALALGFSACEEENLNGCTLQADLSLDDEQQAQLQLDIAAIDSYLTDNGLNAIEHPSGIRYIVHQVGAGEVPNLCNMIEVTYTGTPLSDGSQFDEALKPIEFFLGGVIRGWQILFPEIKEGAEVTLYVPSVYAYGEVARGDDIPENANLVFDITFINFYR